MFNPAAITKLNYLIDRKYTITRVIYDATVSETGGKFSTLTVELQKGKETATIDQFGRVVWHVPAVL